MPRKTNINEGEVAALYAAGATFAVLTKRFHISIERLRDILNAHKIASRPRSVPTPPEVRFWRYVDKNGPTSPTAKGRCWLWTGARDTAGYGMLLVGRTHVVASRLSYEIEFGPIPDGLIICHECDRPACVRSSHLFSGTKKDNTVDALQKGRIARGPNNGKYRRDVSTEEVVRLYASGASARQVAITLGTTHVVVTTRLKQAGVPIRSKSENAFLWHAKKFRLANASD
jgi:HNH endonuclease